MKPMKRNLKNNEEFAEPKWKKRVRRAIAVLVVCVLCAPIAIGLIDVIFGEDMLTFYSQFSMRTVYEHTTEGTPTDAYIRDRDGTQYSFIQYAHTNGIAEHLSEPFRYKADGIIFEFWLKQFSKPNIFFEMGGEEYTIFDRDEALIVKRRSAWPFVREQQVCLLPDAESFYCPISVEGINDYAILVTAQHSSDAHINMVYLRRNNQWEKVTFMLPDKTTTDVLYGYARRHFDYTKFGTTAVTNEAVGNLELCMRDASTGDGAVLYRVFNENDLLLLEPIKQYPDGVPSDWKF